MDITTMRIIATLVSFVTFLGIAAWAYSRSNRDQFEDAAAIPFQQD